MKIKKIKSVIRPLAKIHLLAKITLFGIFFVKFFDRMFPYALKIFQKICLKIANFFKQSDFCKRSIYLLLILMGCSSSVCGLEVRPCYIKDIQKHELNKKLLRDILDQELSISPKDKTPQEQASYLSSNIHKIAGELLQKGFSTEAYEVPILDRNTIVSFHGFPLWEGDKKSIPLTFFVYLWPSKKFALKNYPAHPSNCRYASIIHRHPIPCAFSVLQGLLVQNNYRNVSPMLRKVQFTHKEVFQKGEGDIDELQKPFIHQLYGDGSELLTISLHAYGLSTEEKVMECFRITSSQCAYEPE